MKKLIIIALALVTIQVTAQEKRERKTKKERVEQLKSMSAEDMADIKTKKMTLALDLTESQQKQIRAIQLEKAKQRKEAIKNRENRDRDKLSQEERIQMKKDRLDRQIAHKQEMKSILNKEQYEKWEKMSARKNKKSRMRRVKKNSIEKE